MIESDSGGFYARRTGRRTGGSQDIDFGATWEKVTAELWARPGAVRAAGTSRFREGTYMTSDARQLDRGLADLMRVAQGGDQVAYARLLNALSPLLRRSIKRWRPFVKPEDVEDLVQDTLLSLHEARATYDPARPLLPWVMAIARNRVIDGARRYLARSAREVVVDELPETFSEDATNTAEEGYGDPEALRLALQTLPAGQRQAIEM